MSLAGENKTMTEHADPGQSLPPPSSAPASPIFVVGSPRSGTSVLTWSLAQHPNILVQEESVWMGPLAYQMELAYRMGTARGERSQLSALGVSRSRYFGAFGKAIHRLIIDHRGNLEVRSHEKAMAEKTNRRPPCLVRLQAHSRFRAKPPIRSRGGSMERPSIRSTFILWPVSFRRRALFTWFEMLRTLCARC